MVDLQTELPKPAPEAPKPDFKVVTKPAKDLPPEFRTLGASENLSPDGIGLIYRENDISKQFMADFIKRPYTRKQYYASGSDQERLNQRPLPSEWVCVSGYLHDLPKAAEKFGEAVGTSYREWGAKELAGRIDQAIPNREEGKYNTKQIVPVWPSKRTDECEIWLSGLTKDEVVQIEKAFTQPVEQEVELEDGRGNKAKMFFESSIGVISSQDQDPEMQTIFQELERDLQVEKHPDSEELLKKVRRRMLLKRLHWEETVNGRDLSDSSVGVEQRARIRGLLEKDTDLKLTLSEAKARVNEETIRRMALDAHHNERQKRVVAEKKAELLENKAAIAEEASLKDPLTGLYNRRWLMGDQPEGEDPKPPYHALGELYRQIALVNRAHVDGVPMELAGLMIDVDHFKLINDTYGHPVGDQVLQRIAHLLSTSLRSTDSVVRYGGEEFFAVLPEVHKLTQRDLSTMLNRVLSTIETDDGFPSGIHPTVSIGLTTYPTKNVNSHSGPRDFVKFADAALYEVKRGGRNQVVRFNGYGERGRGEAQFSRVEVSPSS